MFLFESNPQNNVSTDVVHDLFRMDESVTQVCGGVSDPETTSVFPL